MYIVMVVVVVGMDDHSVLLYPFDSIERALPYSLAVPPRHCQPQAMDISRHLLPSLLLSCSLPLLFPSLVDSSSWVFLPFFMLFFISTKWDWPLLLSLFLSFSDVTDGWRADFVLICRRSKNSRILWKHPSTTWYWVDGKRVWNYDFSWDFFSFDYQMRI